MPKVQQARDPRVDRHARRRVIATLSEINVVPLVDVMLVLLIIFMITAPHDAARRGRQTARRAPRESDRRQSRLRHRSAVVPHQSVVYIGDEAMRVSLLPERIRGVLACRTDKEVFLRGDGGIKFQELMDVIDG